MKIVISREHKGQKGIIKTKCCLRSIIKSLFYEITSKGTAIYKTKLPRYRMFEERRYLKFLREKLENAI